MVFSHVMCDFFHCLHDGAKWGEGVLTIDTFRKENVPFDRNDKVTIAQCPDKPTSIVFMGLLYR